MKDCCYIMPDEYPCTEAGVIKVGTKYYCQDHADDVLDENYPIDYMDEFCFNKGEDNEQETT